MHAWHTILVMTPAPLRSQSPRWYWIAGIWVGIGLFSATQTVMVMRSEGMKHAWTSLFVTEFFSWLPWAVATPIVFYLGRKYPPLRLIAVLGHVIVSLAIGLTSAAWGSAFDKALNPFMVSSLILYGCILMVGYMLDSRERLARQQTEAARLNEQLTKAQLNALRQQIEPHFLFNALNAIAGLVREKRNDDAVNMIAKLSDLLRRVLEDSSRQNVTLEERWRLCKSTWTFR